MTLIRSDIAFFDNRFLMFVLDELAYEYEKRYDDVIRMTLGKSELPVSDVILGAMHEALADPEKSALVFPAGLPQLRERIAQYYHEALGSDVRASNVVVSAGTSTVFRNLFSLLATAKDEVLLPLPYYPLYQFCAMLVGATVRYYKIDPQTLAIDFDSLERNISDRTRIVVVNSPGNPLGNIVSREDFRLIDSIVDGRAVIISDEIYQNFSFDGEAPSITQIEGLRSKFIVVNAFSKGYRMYARRVGYAVVPDELVTPLTVIQHHTLLTADPVPQFGAIAALNQPQEVEFLCQLYKSRRDYSLEQFAAVPDIHVIPARGSFYLTLNCQQFMQQHMIADCLTLAKMIMEQQHVATVPGSDFGFPQTLRLSYSSHRYNEGIDRLVRFFLSYKQEKA